MAIAESLDGPWRKVGADGLVLAPSEDPKHWTYRAGNGVNNPAMLKHPNGKYLLYFKSSGARMGVAVADRLEGPHVHQPQPITVNKTAIEDGYAFVGDSKFFFLTTDNHGIIEKVGGLLWESSDGFTFDTVPKLGFYRPSACLLKAEPKKSRHFYGAGTLQRTQVLVQNWGPTHLYVASGSNFAGGDVSVCLVLECERWQ